MFVEWWIFHHWTAYARAVWIRRYAEDAIVESLRAFPAVLVIGARQVGKSTIVRAIARERWPARYVTLDDRAVLDAARADPDGLLAANPAPLVIDEVQRVPDLLRAVKRVADEDRRPGRFLLTGSANVLALRTVSESLAGRMAVHRLLPFAWGELRGVPYPSDLVHDLFAGDGPTARRIAERFAPAPVGGVVGRRELAEAMLRGGYPTPALTSSARTRLRWFESYRQTYLERDVRDIANLEHMDAFGRLVTLLALRTGTLANHAELARDAGLPQSTLRRYLNLLHATFQIDFVPPFVRNPGRRLVKSPKLFFGDTGLALALSGFHAWDRVEAQHRAGAVVETWVAAELAKLCEYAPFPVRLHHWRAHSGREVDFVLERGPDLVAVEVKWTTSPSATDAAGLRAFVEDYGPAVRAALLLHAGEAVLALDERTVLLPMQRFFLGR